MGKILNPIPPELEGTVVIDIETKLCVSNDDLISAIVAVRPDLSYVKESTGYHRFDEPWWFSGRILVGSLRSGPKTIVAIRGSAEYFNIASGQPWKIIKPVTLIGKLRCPAAGTTP